MRTKLAFLISLLLLGSGSFFNARADVNIGVRADESGIKEFYLAIGDHYRAPEKEVVMVRERGIPDDDLPVVYFIARRAVVPPIAVIKLRMEGRSWMDITFHYGLTAEVYYMEVGKVKGPPYGKAYGHFKNTPRKEWNTIKLADADVVNFVNLRFLSEHYGYSSDEIISMRSKGESFAKINAKVKQAKQNQKQKKMTTAKSVKGKTAGKAKEKKK